MATKQPKSSSMNLDDYGFGDEFDFDEFEFDPKPPKDNREAIRRVASSTKDEVISQIKSPSFFRGLIRKALPRGYGQLMDLADSAASSVKELYNEGEKELKPALSDLSRTVDKLMPQAEKYLPKGAKDSIKAFAEKNREQQTGLGNKPIDNVNDLAVAAMIQDTFKHTVKDNNRREAQDNVRDELKSVMQNQQHIDNIGQLDQIRRGVSQMAAYQSKIEYGFHRKSLELQMRHYFVAVDTLNEQKRSNARIVEQLSGVVHNTSLPDIIKTSISEKFKDRLKNKFSDSINASLFGNRDNFVGRMSKALQQQAIGGLKAGVDGLRSGLFGVEQLADAASAGEDFGVDKYKAAGMMGGSFISDFLQNQIGKRLNGRIDRDKTSKLARGVRRVGNRLEHFTNNPAQYATDFANQSTSAGDYARQALSGRAGEALGEKWTDRLTRAADLLGNPILDFTRGTIHRANAMDTNITQEGANQLHEAAPFSKRDSKSISEIIPGYLARILQEQQIMRTGDATIDLTTFDYSRGQFTSSKKLKQRIMNRLVTNEAKSGLQYERNSILDQVDPDGKLTPDQRQILADRLMGDNLGHRAGYATGNIRNYTNEYAFDTDDKEREHAGTFTKLFQALEEKNKASDQAENTHFGQRFSNLGRSAVDRRADVEDLLKLYPREMLEELELLERDSQGKFNGRINMRHIQELHGGKAMNVNATLAGGRVRGVLSGAVPSTTPTGIPHVAGHAEDDNPLMGEINRLIATLEAQNAKPLIAEIKDILLRMEMSRASPEGMHEVGPGTMDQVMDGLGIVSRGASDLYQRARSSLTPVQEQAMRKARRAARQAKVAAGRLWNRRGEVTDRVDQFVDEHNLRGQADDLQEQATRKARRLARQAKVAAGRLWNRRGQLRANMDQFAEDHDLHGRVDDLQSQAQRKAQELRDRAQAAWAGRPTTEQMREAANNGMGRVRGMWDRAYAGATNAGENIRQEYRTWRDRPTPEAVPESNDLLKNIRDTLLDIKQRLDDGILTQAYPEGGIPQGAGGTAGKRGLLSRLNFRLSDIAKGTWGLGKKAIGVAASVGNAIGGGAARMAGKVVSGGFGLARDTAGFIGGNLYRRARGFVDIYVGNEYKPRMYGRMMQEGNVYFNQEDGKPIRQMKDITGTVVSRINGEEKVVLEADEIDKAWQRVGPVKKTLKALGVIAKTGKNILGKALGVITSGIPPIFRAGWWAAKKAWGLLDMAQDIFVKGQTDPAMTARLMRAGVYYSAVSGKKITSPSKIDGPVLIGEGDQVETVLTHDDIRKGLVDKNGMPIRSGLMKLLTMGANVAKRAFKIARKVGSLAYDAAASVVNTGIAAGRGIYKAGVGTAGFVLDRLRGKPMGEHVPASLEASKKSLTWLEKIHNVLDSRLPKKNDDYDDADHDGVRDGSYEDQQKRAQEKAQSDAARTTAPGGAGPVAAGSGIGGMAKGLWDKLRGKKKEGEEEDDGVDINVDGPDGERTRRSRKPKGPGFKETKGVWGKTKWLGKTAGSKLWSGAKWAGSAALGLSGLGSLGIGGAVAGAGSMLASGAAAAAGMAGTAAAAIGGVLTLPVLLGAAAVGAAGVGGYYAYKALTRRSLTALSRVRYVQYGFNPTDKDHVNAVFGLEDKLKPGVVYGKDGPTLDKSKIDIPSLIKDFGVDDKDDKAMNNWLRWFTGRFKPVFLTHVAALNQVAPGKWLSEVDNLDGNAKKAYFNMTKYPDGPYSETTSPFEDLKELATGAGDVRAIVELAKGEIEKDAKSDSAGIEKAALTAGAAVGIAEINKDSTTPGVDGKVGGVNPALVAKIAAQTLDTTGLANQGARTTVAGSSTVLTALAANSLDAIDVVRMKTYGLVKMEADKVRAIRALEAEIEKDLTYSNKVAKWSGALQSVLKTCGPAFGVDASDDKAAGNWMGWFIQRFLPAYLNYATVLNGATGKEVPSAAKGLLKNNQLVDVANSIFTTSNKIGGGSNSVWSVTSSPWPDYQLNTDVKSVDANIQGLKEAAKNAIMAEPATKGASGARGPDGKPIDSKTPESGNWFTKSISKVISTVTGGSPSGLGGSAGTAGGIPMGGSGRTVDLSGTGSGGEVDGIPMPKGNGTWASMKDTILAAAKMVGVDEKLMAVMAAIESGFDANAKAGTSSASGLYQFIDGTWKTMIQRYGKKYGIDPGANQRDPRANALMGAEYIKENVGALQKVLKRPLTDTDIYFAHFLGSAGAQKLLTADPSAIAADILPQAARANQAIFYRNGQALTVGEVYKLVQGRVLSKGKQFGIDVAGGEAIVEKSAPATPATGVPSTAPSSVSGAPTAPAVPGDKSSTAAPVSTSPTASVPVIGSKANDPSATAKAGTPAPAPVPTAVQPAKETAPIGPVVPGPAPMGISLTKMTAQDSADQSRAQAAARSVDMRDTNEILSKSLGFHEKQFNLLGDIKTVLTDMAKASKADSKAASATSSNATQSSQMARQAPRSPTNLPSPPISVAKPTGVDW